MDTLKITFLIDNADQTVLDVDCSPKWPNDAKLETKRAPGR